ncbi:hypothetical protein HYV71_03930 [Candidatus Uhrbacteria bacterium]|nr:hypothetical protein [Candidatus Uhrbacteria bacterium]
MVRLVSTPHQYLHEVAKRNSLHHAYLCIGSNEAEMNGCVQTVIDSLPSTLRIDCQPEEEGMSISIINVRDLISRLSRANPAGQLTFVVIRPAAAMTREAENALLKILEEPPRGIIFILLAKRARDLLPTVVSRCHLIRFALQNKSVQDSRSKGKVGELMKSDFQSQLSLAQDISCDEFDDYELLLSNEIRSNIDSVKLQLVLKQYQGMRRASRARTYRVNPQGCVDLLYL